MNLASRAGALSEILERLGTELDVSPEVDARLTAEYDELTAFLSEGAYRVEGEIYPQGSRRLGTMVRPVQLHDDYDVDLVFCWYLAKASSTQNELKMRVGAQLRAFVAAKEKSAPETAPELTEGSRCWTLSYPGFHIDILPAIPNEEHLSPRNSILITDREVRLWQVSNPRDYAEWFKKRSERAFVMERARLAKSRGVEVEAIPEHEVRTPLHRAVQLLKRHRDLHFDGPPDDKPASIIITTLAAMAYAHGASVSEAIRHVFDRFANGIEERDGVSWVPNPVDPEENFADRWRYRPQRRAAFLRWATQARVDLTAATEAMGLDEVTKSLGSAFGESAAKRAVSGLGTAALLQRTAGHLLVSSGGALGSSKGRVVKDHTFFGS